jgi:intein/homing endonuclease
MDSNHSVSKRKSNTGAVYRIQVGSKVIYEDLINRGYAPTKTKRMRVPVIPKKYISDFIRGYFDGDGNVWIGFVNRQRTNPTKVIQVSFTSGSDEFLKDVLTILRTKGIQGGSIYSSKVKNFSRLTFSTKDALKIGEIMYNNDPKLYLKRKRLRFDQFWS